MSWESSETDRRPQVEVECDCGHRFPIPKSMKGGVVNCPACGKITEAPQAAEPVFWLLIAVAVIIALSITATAFVTGGPTAGIISLVIFVTIGTLILVFL